MNHLAFSAGFLALDQHVVRVGFALAAIRPGFAVAILIHASR